MELVAYTRTKSEEVTIEVPPLSPDHHAAECIEVRRRVHSLLFALAPGEAAADRIPRLYSRNSDEFLGVPLGGLLLTGVCALASADGPEVPAAEVDPRNWRAIRFLRYEFTQQSPTFWDEVPPRARRVAYAGTADFAYYLGAREFPLTPEPEPEPAQAADTPPDDTPATDSEAGQVTVNLRDRLQVVDGDTLDRVTRSGPVDRPAFPQSRQRPGELDLTNTWIFVGNNRDVSGASVAKVLRELLGLPEEDDSPPWRRPSHTPG